MFERNGDGSWSLAQTLVASDGETSDGFGANIDIEGVRMIVGASGHDESADQDRGAAYVFERPPGSVGGGWVETAKLVRPNGAAQDFFGGGVAMSGDRVLVTANSADTHGTNFGAADVFERESDGSWRHAADLAGSAGCKRFGVDIDGSTAVGRGQISQPCGTSIDVYDLPSLVGFADTISLASDGSAAAPAARHGARRRFLFGSVTGTSPGYPVIGTPWTLPPCPTSTSSTRPGRCSAAVCSPRPST
ncbi:MAG: FG-GAP repeat protein [Planctomycetota bacterium]